MVTLFVAAQLTVSVAVADTVRACEPFTVAIIGSARGIAAPQLVAPDVRPFTLVGSRATTQSSTDVDGRRWSLTDVVLTLLVERPGRYTLPAFELRSGRVRARSRRATVVVAGDDTSATPAIVARAQLDSGADVSMRSMIAPDTVWVGEQATYQVGVFISPEARDKLRGNPNFVPPQLNALMAYDFPASSRRTIRRRVGTRCFDVLVYERAVFPLAAGRHELSPAQLSYAMSVGAGFFAGSERRETRSDAAAVVARELPQDGRPEDFAGAVGEFTAAARADTAGARVGDPLLLTMRVEGEGNMKLLPRPRVVIPWAGLVAGDERVRIDTAARRVRGAKEFDWILTPRQSGAQEIPALRYPYWNPQSARYELAQTDPETLFVAPGALAHGTNVDSARAAPLSIRRVLRPAAPAPLPTHPGFAIVAALAPLPALTAALARRGRRAPRAVGAAVRLRALRRSRGASAAAARRLLERALIERGVAHPADFARSEQLLRALRHAGVSATTASRATAFLEELADASYSPRHRTVRDAAARACTMLRDVEREARPRVVLRPPSALLVIALCAGVVAAGAAARDSAGAIFSDAVAAYDARQYALAAARFDSVAALGPRSVDALANAGTASWMNGDTVDAVRDWHHALRLAPLDGELRERLDLTPGPARGALAWVPPLPLAPLAVAALVVWWLAWLAVAGRILWHERSRTAWAYAGFGIAGALAAIYILADERLAARSLAVVASQSTLHALPSLAADPGAAVRTGEVVRVVRREGAWAQVAAVNRDVGWIESDQLRTIARD
ncbi:MAG TPA: BatD family protein [Gemmatimonadaceae bacterium]|nr:BatD family protein [Gemmatimonadaceae bacterium]